MSEEQEARKRQVLGRGSRYQMERGKDTRGEKHRWKIMRYYKEAAEMEGEMCQASHALGQNVQRAVGVGFCSCRCD